MSRLAYRDFSQQSDEYAQSSIHHLKVHRTAPKTPLEGAGLDSGQMRLSVFLVGSLGLPDARVRKDY